MKVFGSTLALGLALGLAAPCAAQTPAQAAEAAPSSTQANITVVQAFLKALNQGEQEVAESYVTPETRWWIQGLGIQDTREVIGEWIGPKGVKKVRRPEAEGAGSSGWSDTSKWLSSPDGRIAMETTGDSMTNGKRYANTYVFVWTVKNGKITEVHEYLDTAYTYKRFGITPNIGDAAMRPDSNVKFSRKQTTIK